MTVLRRIPETTQPAGRRVQLTTDGVLVAYIHAISERHRPAEPEANAPPPPAVAD